MEDSLKKSYAEVSKILSYMDKEYIDKIPQKFKNLIEKEKMPNYNPYINLSISLANQNLQRKTLVILAILNLNYWCENEEKKKELINIYSENDKNREAESRKKYNPDNLFKTKQQSISNNYEKENILEMIEYKESFLTKLFKKIKTILKK